MNPVVVIFSVFVAFTFLGNAFAAGTTNGDGPTSGTTRAYTSPDWWVSNIQGNNVTLKNSAGQTQTIVSTSASAFKVGDKVNLQGNTLVGSTSPATAGQVRETPIKLR